MLDEKVVRPPLRHDCQIPGQSAGGDAAHSRGSERRHGTGGIEYIHTHTHVYYRAFKTSSVFVFVFVFFHRLFSPTAVKSHARVYHTALRSVMKALTRADTHE